MLCNAYDDMSNFSARSKHQRCYIDQAFRSERWARVRKECRSSLARPSGWRLDRPWPIVRVFGPAQELRIVRNIVCWAELLLGSRSMRDPRFMNPTPSFP